MVLYCTVRRECYCYPTDQISTKLVVCFTSTVQPESVLSRYPNWPDCFIGETFILKCTILEGRDSDWEYTWWKNNTLEKDFKQCYIKLTETGEYKCKGRHKHDQRESKVSNITTVTFKGVIHSG